MQGGEPAWQQRNNSTAYLGFLVTNIRNFLVLGRNVDFSAMYTMLNADPQTLALGHAGLPKES